MNFLYFAVIALLPSCFAVVLPDLEKHAIEEQLGMYTDNRLLLYWQQIIIKHE